MPQPIMQSLHLDHAVQFYEDSGSILDSVSAFLATGLEDGDASVVIATPAHRAELEDLLTARGIDMTALRLEFQPPSVPGGFIRGSRRPSDPTRTNLSRLDGRSFHFPTDGRDDVGRRGTVRIA
jgi:MEDS: MEthanogen/methylotroph, DcmR Sensory domain